MNHILQKFARNWLKENIAGLPASNHRMFNLMYAKGKDRENTLAKLDDEVSIDHVIENMDDDKIDWAMCQVENSLKNLGTGISHEITQPELQASQDINTEQLLNVRASTEPL